MNPLIFSLISLILVAVSANFLSLIKELRSKNDIKAPLFDRSADKVIKDAQTISREQDYLVIEGNYLLLDRELWRDLSKYWDYKIFLTVEETILKSRLIELSVVPSPFL